MRAALAVAALLAAGCAAPGAPPAPAPAAAAKAPAPAAGSGDVLRVVPLRNAGFEEPHRPGERCPVGWACTMHNDPEAFRFVPDEASPASGKRSLCVERVRNEPWALATLVVSDPALAGRVIRFSIALRAEGLPGPGAGPWVLVHGAQGNLAHHQRLVKATRGWERHSIELTVPPGAQMVQLGATLEGPGRACLDDARLEVLRKSPPAA